MRICCVAHGSRWEKEKEKREERERGQEASHAFRAIRRLASGALGCATQRMASPSVPALRAPMALDYQKPPKP